MTCITESGRKKNKQARTWVIPKCKKEEISELLWHSVAIASVYPNEIPTQLATKNPDSSSRTGWAGFWVQKS